MFEAL